MNIIKYVHPRTGHRRSIRVTQIAQDRRVQPALMYPREADRAMRLQGYVRANGKKLQG